MPRSREAYSPRRKEKKKARSFKDWLIIFLTFVLVVYALSFFRHLTLNKAQGTEEPIYIRVQILNGCGKDGVANKIRERLISKSWGDFVFDAVEVNDFGDSTVSHTLILDRKGQDRIAYQVADVLGIKKENVLTKKLEDNYLDIDLALVLGADYYQIFKK